MSTVRQRQASDSSGNDPLGFSLKSIPETLQRWWLIGQGNPYFEAELRKLRRVLGIPEPGFTDPAGFVEWVSQKASRHGHNTKLPIYLRIDGQILDDPESLTRFRYRDLSWPVPESALPGRCCLTDPLFQEAEYLAQRFAIDIARFEPGFPDATETVVGYLLVNRWPRPRSLSGTQWTEEIDKIVPHTGKRMVSRVSKVVLGLKSRAGEGRQLPLWYKWWMLDQERRSIPEIAGIADLDLSNPRNYDERTIRLGIDAVERLMTPVEKLSNS